MTTRTLATALMLLLVLLAGQISSSGATIFWGTKPNDLLFDSSGNALDSRFIFEIGVFNSGVTPMASNMDHWAANWMVFDAALLGDGWDANQQEVNASADHTLSGGSSSPDALPASVFAQGQQAYLWVYDSKSYALTSEWALLADLDKGPNVFPGGWEFPDPSDELGSFDWQTRDLDTAIFGGVNDIQGEGFYTVNPGTFTLQTHAVPEPGSALLLTLAGWLVLNSRTLARRRSLTP